MPLTRTKYIKVPVWVIYMLLIVSMVMFAFYPSSKLASNRLTKKYVVPQTTVNLGVLDVDDGVEVSESDVIRRMYVIPGGGPGNRSSSYVSSTSSSPYGYPEWTRRRTIAAVKHHKEASEGDRRGHVFLALSAGSLNGPNARGADDRIAFESSHMLDHLAALGVDPRKCHGDWMSWDTIGNALVLRMFMEGVLASAASRSTLARSIPLDIHVFISDFHLSRMRAAFDWIIPLAPKIDTWRNFTLSMHSVSSEGIHWPNNASYEDRIQHERLSTEITKRNAARIKSFPHFLEWFMGGGHAGLRKYLHSNHAVSSGAGW